MGDSISQPPEPDKDPFNLALLKHYRSLMPMAMEAHKPMFFLKSACRSNDRGPVLESRSLSVPKEK